MRLPDSAHHLLPWRIHEIAWDFRLEDVWQLPGTGSSADFERVLHGFASGDPTEDASRATAALFALRWKLGELFGWDDAEEGLTSRVPTLRARLPDDLRGGPRGPDFEALPFTPLYLAEDEFAGEIANATMHGLMHLGRVRSPSGAFRVQMAVLVKPNGLLGGAYMAAIRPFRHLIVYPALMRRIEREARAGEGAPADA